MLEVCWNEVGRIDLSEIARHIMTDQGIPGSDMDDWSARLSLPLLSCPEVLALRKAAQEAVGKERASKRNASPRNLAIYILAHRLDVQAETIARKVIGAAASERFVGEKNPVDAIVDDEGAQ